MLSVREYLHNLIWKCNRCFDTNSFYLYYYDLKAYQDYPPIAIIEDYYVYDYDKRSRYDKLEENIYKKLNISKYECFITYCAKCYRSEKKKDLLRFSEKFQNCYKHLNTEISVLQPVLLIAIDETVVNMLKTKYEIKGFSETPCLCSITIEGKQYPLLAVDNIKMNETNVFLSQISDEIKAILTQPRNLPTPKPRVIKIESE